MWGRSIIIMGFPGGSDSPPAMLEPWVWFLGGKEPLQKGMATCSSILAWRIPWTEESDGLQYIGPQRIEHNWVTNPFTFFSFRSIIILPSPHIPAPYQEFPMPYFPSFLGLSARLRFIESHSSLFFFSFNLLHFILSSLLFPPSPFLPSSSFPLPFLLFFFFSFLPFYQVNMHFSLLFE